MAEEHLSELQPKHSIPFADKEAYPPKPSAGPLQWHKENTLIPQFGTESGLISRADLKNSLAELEGQGFNHHYKGKGIYQIALPEGGHLFFNRQDNTALLTNINEKSLENVASLFKEMNVQGVNVKNLPPQNQSKANAVFTQPNISLVVSGLSKAVQNKEETDLRLHRR